MAEYIEREALMIEHEQYITEHPEVRQWAWSARLILNAPAADVQPVVHGHWNDNDTCSVCGEAPLYDYSVLTLNYCSNCGARMDEE